MTPREISLVQDSFAKVVPIADMAASLFYQRLFEVAPQVRPMFKGDMADQGRKLMATLGVVVGGLNNPAAIAPAVSALATRHASYGVTASHYSIVGEALLWTLEKGLGEAWTSDIAAAWAEAYAMLSKSMIGVAYGQRN